MIKRIASRPKRRMAGWMLPACFAMAALLATFASVALYLPAPPDRAVTETRSAVQQLKAAAMIKGYSRAEELGSLSCPDRTGDGIADYCPLEAGNTGYLPDRVAVGAGQLTLTPGKGNATPTRLHYTVDKLATSGEDMTSATTGEAKWLLASGHIPVAVLSSDTMTRPLSGDTAQTVAFVSDEADRTFFSRSGNRTELSHLAQQRVKAAFLSHLQMSAQQAGRKLDSTWAFQETQHLTYEPDSAGTRFAPSNSGCQCNCTKTRCKCACTQTSTWESRNACQSAPDGGECRTKQVAGTPMTQCTATPGRFCYLTGESWLLSRWVVSLYSPRATEGRSCRPERIDSCPLTTKTGTTCSCTFDWPRPLSTDRLSRLRLQFESNNPRATLLP